MTVTMHDIAKAAGVSISTVSHVINNTRPIAPETRDRVLKAIDELQYYVNSSARLLVRGFSDALGLIISDIENPFFPQLIKGFELACHEHNLELILGMTNYEQPSATAAVRRMIEDKVRGVAIMSMEFDSKLVLRLLDRGIPVVRLDSRRVQPNESSVLIDYSIGVHQAVQHLAQLGHRRVAILHGPLKVLSARRYRRLLLESAHEHGLTVACCIEVESRPTGGASGLREIAEKRSLPTAVLCGNDLIALGALGEAIRSGIAVPREMSIIGSDDIAIAEYCQPALSTIRVQKDKVGLHAFELLQKMFTAEKKESYSVEVKTEFVARESTGPALGVKMPAARKRKTAAERN
jgi:DNA-binding LacI/PurR family transcriptional regulator